MIGKKAIIFGLGSILWAAFASSASAGEAAIRQTGTPFKGLEFIENKGQWDSTARFLTRSANTDVWVTNSGIVYDFYRLRKPVVQHDKATERWEDRMDPTFRSGQVVSMTFDGADRRATTEGVSQKPGVYNYILPQGTFSGAGLYEESRIKNLYPGIDCRVYFDGGRPRYDIVVQPGGDVSQIAARFDGAFYTKKIDDHTIGLGTRYGEVKVSGLYAFQRVNTTERPVQVRFKVDKGAVRYEIGEYDHTKPLIIDPVVWSTLLGAAGGTDICTGVTVDVLQEPIVCGTTNGTQFPTVYGSYDEFISGQDAFVTKLDREGHLLLFSTFIGGTGAENANGIARASNGDLVIVGTTTSTNFPTSPLCFQPNNAGQNGAPRIPDELGLYAGPTDAFVFRLSADGSSRVWASYLGGKESRWPWTPRPSENPNCVAPYQSPAASDVATGVQVNSDGDIVVVGFTRSSNFPVPNAVQNTFKGPLEVPSAGGCDPGVGPGTDGFITKIKGDGTSLLASTYMGAALNDSCSGVVITQGENRITVVGSTASVGGPGDPAAFVTTAGAFDRTINNQDAFIVQMNAANTVRMMATALGGNADESGAAIGIDNQNNIFIAGQTTSTNFPTTVGALDRTYNNGVDMYLTKFNAALTELTYSTLCGVSGSTAPVAVVVDDTGVAYLTGWVSGQVLTTVTEPTDPRYRGTYSGPPPLPGPPGDAFLLAFNEAGSQLLYGGYWGGDEYDDALGMAIDPSRNVYVVGRTRSYVGKPIPFPTTPGVYKEQMILDTLLPPALFDGFVWKMNIRIGSAIQSFVVAPNDLAGNQSCVGTITLTGPASAGGAIVGISTSEPTVLFPDTDIVFIPEGQTTATVNLSSVEVTDVHVVGVTAKMEGDQKTVGVTVAPWLTALTVSPSQIVGGNHATGRVTLYKPAPTGGATVDLATSNSGLAKIPKTVTIAAGLTTAVFDIDTEGVGSDTPVQISAIYKGVAKTETLIIKPARLTSLRFNPNRVSPTQSSQCIVALDGKAGSPIQIAIDQTSGTAALGFPATATILPGNREVSFTVTTPIVPADSFGILRARRNPGLTEPVSGTLLIDRTDLQSITLTKYSVLGGEVITGRVNLTNAAASGGLTVDLSVDNGALGSVSPATVTVPAGSTQSNQFTLTTNSVSTTQLLTVSASKVGYTTVTAVVTVRALDFTFSISPTSVIGGVENATGTVTLSEASPPGGLTLNLTSSNTSAATVPATVTIPAGDQTVTFTISSIAVPTDTSSTITGTIGVVAKQRTLTVRAPGVIGLSLNPTAVTGGSPSTGTVTLDSPAPVGGMVVTLSSTNPAVAAPASATVTVPEGTTTATFTVNSFAVAADTSAIIRATRGATSASATLSVLAPVFSTLTFNPSTVRGGLTSTATLSLDQPAPPGGIVVNLSASPSSLITQPAQVTILAGHSSVSWTISTTAVSRTIAVQITATFASRPGSISSFIFLTR